MATEAEIAAAAAAATAAEAATAEAATKAAADATAKAATDKAAAEAAAKATADKATADAATKAAADKVVADKAAADKADADKTPEYDTKVWGTTGDDVGDSVLRLLSDSGVSVDDAKSMLYEPIKDGDASKIDRKALVDKVGDANATLIMAGIENFMGKQAAKLAVETKVIFDAAGSKENWDTMLPWVKTNVPEADLKEFRTMIDTGGRSAKMAVTELRALYDADPKTKALTAARTIEGDVTQAAKVDGLTRREYGDKLAILHRRNLATPAALAALSAARKAGKAKGV